jgi:hypothetical protein
MHNSQESLDDFLQWLNSKSSGLSSQIPINKNQLQELLLGAALVLRDLEFCCFTDHDEIHVPSYIVNGCMRPSDIDSIAEVVEAISKAVKDELK